MKRTLSIVLLLLACYGRSAGQGNPAVSSLGFSAAPLPLGATNRLTAVVSNATFSSGTVPAGQFEVQLTLPSNQVYTPVNGNTTAPATAQISDNDGNNFSWVGDGEGYYIGTSTRPIAQGAQITITVNIYGRTLAGNTGTTLNVQGLLGTAATNVPGDDNAATTLAVVAGPLPVKVKDFTAAASGCNAQLQWHTAGDESFDHFEIEHSNNGVDYTQVGSVTSKGQAGGAGYDFTCAAPSGNNFYRLKIVDLGGHYVYSQTVSVNITCNTRPVTVSPNPTRDLVFLSGLQPGRMELFDATGRQLLSREVSNSEERISLGNYAPGVYRLVLFQGTDKQSIQILRIE